MSTKLTVGALQPRHSPNADVTLAVPDAATGFWLFNRPPGATDAQALAVGRRNRVPLAANGPDDNVFPGALPTVFTDFWRFSPGSPLLTRIPETPLLTILVLCRCPATIGATSRDRAFVAGNYGNTQNQGFGLEFNSTANIRATGYDDTTVGAVTTGDTVKSATATLNTGDSHNKWRIYLASENTTSMNIKNKTGDGLLNQPATPPPYPNGHPIGLQTLSIGARIGASPGSEYLWGVDIAAIMTTAGNWDTTQEAAMLAQFRKQIALTGIVEGAAIPA